jgi:hypothetical protein
MIKHFDDKLEEIFARTNGTAQEIFNKIKSEIELIDFEEKLKVPAYMTKMVKF